MSESRGSGWDGSGCNAVKEKEQPSCLQVLKDCGDRVTQIEHVLVELVGQSAKEDTVVSKEPSCVLDALQMPLFDFRHRLIAIYDKISYLHSQLH